MTKRRRGGSGGWSTVQIRMDLKKKFKEIYDKDPHRPRAQSFNNYLDNLFTNWIEYERFIERDFNPGLEFVKAEEDAIFIKDTRPGKLNTTVYIRDKELRCTLDESTDCIHVGFCFAIPEVYKVLVSHGFKEPKRSMT